MIVPFIATDHLWYNWYVLMYSIGCYLCGVSLVDFYCGMHFCRYYIIKDVFVSLFGVLIYNYRHVCTCIYVGIQVWYCSLVCPNPFVPVCMYASLSVPPIILQYPCSCCICTYACSRWACLCSLIYFNAPADVCTCMCTCM